MIFGALWVTGVMLQTKVFGSMTKGARENWNTLVYLAGFEITIEFFAIAVMKEVAE